MTAGNLTCYARHMKAAGAAFSTCLRAANDGVRTDRTLGRGQSKPLETGQYVPSPTGRWPHDKGPERCVPWGKSGPILSTGRFRGCSSRLCLQVAEVQALSPAGRRS